MADCEQFYQMSVKALTQWIIENKDVPTEKVWNRLAGTEGYLTSQSLGYLSQMKFAQLCKKLHKNIQIQNKKEKK